MLDKILYQSLQPKNFKKTFLNHIPKNEVSIVIFQHISIYKYFLFEHLKTYTIYKLIIIKNEFFRSDNNISISVDEEQI